jgi:hypothetical protein
LILYYLYNIKQVNEHFTQKEIMDMILGSPDSDGSKNQDESLLTETVKCSTCMASEHDVTTDNKSEQEAEDPVVAEEEIKQPIVQYYNN